MTLQDIAEMNAETHKLAQEQALMSAFDSFADYRTDMSARDDFDAYSERVEMLVMQFHYIDAVRIERKHDSFHHVIVRTLNDAHYACSDLNFDENITLQKQCFRFDNFADFKRFLMHCVELVLDEQA